MAKNTALDTLKAELSRLQDTIKQYEQHQTRAGQEAALQARRIGQMVHYHDTSAGNCPDRAAVKRASMDVTKALARLRREAGTW